MARQLELSLFKTSREVGRIPLVLVLGDEGAGKTEFLSMLLRQPAMLSSVVVGAASDTAQTRLPARYIPLPAGGVLSEDACLCCGMQSGLGDVLRKLFFEALADRGHPLDRVFIESCGIESGQLSYTLRHTPFLGQRYMHQLTFRVVTAAQLLSGGVAALKVSEPIERKNKQFLVISQADGLSDQQFVALADPMLRNSPYQKVLRLGTNWLATDADVLASGENFL